MINRNSFVLLLILSISVQAQSVSAATPEGTVTPVVKNAVLGTNMSSSDFRKEPTFIKSDALTVQSEKRIFSYVGRAEVKQADMTLTSDRIDGEYDENNQIKTLTALKNVVITKGDKLRATGQKAIYTAATATIVLTENPTLTENGNMLSADIIKVLLNENRSLAEGDVQVKLVNTQGTPTPIIPVTPGAAAGTPGASNTAVSPGPSGTAAVSVPSTITPQVIVPSATSTIKAAGKK